MERNIFGYMLLIAPVIVLSVNASALECERGLLSIRADAGNYAYGEVVCTSYSGLYAEYEGNMSDYISVFVRGSGNRYVVSLLADATGKNSGNHVGRILLENDDGEELEIRTKVRIGEGGDEEITLGKYGLHFELDKPGAEACYNVSIKNTGNAGLWDLHAEYGNAELETLAYNNKSWIYISDLKEQEFSAGAESSLKICVNTKRMRGTELPDQETSVYVVAHEPNAGNLREEIKVTLRTDLGTAWQRNYEELLSQHRALEANYSELRAYKMLWEEKFLNGSTALYTYSALSKAYRDLKADYAALEKRVNSSNYAKYENISGRLADLKEKYEALKENYSDLKAQAQNMSDGALASALENESRLLRADILELSSILEDLRAQLEEKEAVLAAIQAKQKKNAFDAERKDERTGGFFEEYVPFLPLLAVPFFAIFALVALMTKGYHRRAERKKQQQKIPVISKKDGWKEREKKEEETQREQQKEMLRKIIIQKLAEKAAEKKNG